MVSRRPMPFSKLRNLFRSRAKAADADRSPDAPRSYIAPNYQQWNKDYQEGPFAEAKTRARFDQLVQGAGEIVSVNHPDSAAFLADDMFVWFRSVAFLSDPAFIAAMGPLRNDPGLRGRIWRVNLLCWAARNALALDGDFVDVGCYDGRTVSVMQRYCGFAEHREKTWWLYDIFEDPPHESRKAAHGPGLFEQVRDEFESLGNFRVIKGAVPDSFAQGLPNRIAFAQIDLNEMKAEVACLEAIYERVVPSGIIVLDDFGFGRYRESFEGETAFFAARGQFVWESPTGQGLVIKR